MLEPKDAHGLPLSSGAITLIFHRCEAKTSWAQHLIRWAGEAQSVTFHLGPQLLGAGSGTACF